MAPVPFPGPAGQAESSAQPVGGLLWAQHWCLSASAPQFLGAMLGPRRGWPRTDTVGALMPAEPPSLSQAGCPPLGLTSSCRLAHKAAWSRPGRGDPAGTLWTLACPGPTGLTQPSPPYGAEAGLAWPCSKPPGPPPCSAPWGPSKGGTASAALDPGHVRLCLVSLPVPGSPASCG